jgi:hypothetical protein
MEICRIKIISKKVVALATAGIAIKLKGLD